ncbi:hypothetical protein [[Kitasatospora] papulosa]|uniref:hypothetical protein n=1 Tax=[Kitasatospora] papulosa TaxID=1464011 RepID=UPI00367CBDFB
MTVRTEQASEFRTVVYKLPDSAPEVPLPYGGGHLIPSHIRIELSRHTTGICTGKARVFGKWRNPGGDLTSDLEDAEFRLDGHWIPDWVAELIHAACPIGWQLSRS